MDLADKLITINVMKKLKTMIEYMVAEYYPVISEWAKLDVEEEILRAKEPNLYLLKRLDDVIFDTP